MPQSIIDITNPSLTAAEIRTAAAGEESAWHRVDAAELWLWHAGAPLALRISTPQSMQTCRLGPALTAGERLQGVVEAHAWQAARSEGAWSLISCIVAPAFDFAGFELAPPGFAP
jgi:uncharacterized protein